MSKRVNQTGRRKSVAAPPAERLERHCPHLAFIEAARYDRLLALLGERNAKFKRKGINGVDTRKNVPKKRTVWPGQHIDCGVCRRPYVYGGHGQMDHLVCRGAHDYKCWNAVTADGPLAAAKLLAAIREAIANLPDFDPVLMQLVQDQLRQRQGARGQQHEELGRRLARVDREILNIVAAVRAAGHSPSLLEELQRLETEKTRLAREQQDLARPSNAVLTMPSIAEVKGLAEQAIATLAVTSPEFGRLLRRLIPRLVVFPYRLCDGGHPVLRARFTLCLTSLLPTGAGLDRLAPALQRSLVVELFNPPQREIFRVPVMELTAAGVTQREIARRLSLTQPAVQGAVALARQMKERAIDDPYLVLTAPPDDYGRLRRHRHPRYRFEPLGSEELESPAQA
jgi:hypothetical protein